MFIENIFVGATRYTNSSTEGKNFPPALNFIFFKAYIDLHRSYLQAAQACGFCIFAFFSMKNDVFFTVSSVKKKKCSVKGLHEHFNGRNDCFFFLLINIFSPTSYLSGERNQCLIILCYNICGNKNFEALGVTL